MKILLTAWLLYGGAVVPESISQRHYSTIVECQAKGAELKAYFDGRKTLHTAEFICTEEGINT